MTNQFKISLELLYHYSCPSCSKWWSIADIQPIPGNLIHCPHCAAQHQVPSEMNLGDGSSQPLSTLADQIDKAMGSLALAINDFAEGVNLEKLFTDENLIRAAALLGHSLSREDEALLRQILIAKSQPGIPNF